MTDHLLQRHTGAYLLAIIDEKLIRVHPDDRDYTPPGTQVFKVGEPVRLTMSDGSRHVDREGAYSVEFPFTLKNKYQALPRFVRPT